MATALLLVLLLHLLPGLVVGLATYELVQLLVKFLKIVKIHQIRAKLAAVSLPLHVGELRQGGAGDCRKSFFFLRGV